MAEQSVPQIFLLQVDYFDEGAWYAMADFVMVYGKENVWFTFKNGMEIKL